MIIRRRQLEAALHEYIRHYNVHRPHRALGLHPPAGTPAPLPATRASSAQVERRDRLGGLLHEYELAA